jgi:hypothetical protein
MEDGMEHLIFVCPTTGRTVDSGVETEIGTLLRIRQHKVRVLCPACVHTMNGWWVTRSWQRPPDPTFRRLADAANGSRQDEVQNRLSLAHLPQFEHFNLVVSMG